MSKRNILDHEGTVIGELELPEGTSELEWAAKLAWYARHPKTSEELQSDLINQSVEERRRLARILMDQIKARNLALGINGMQALWAHHRLRALGVNFMGLEVTIDIMNLIVSGDMEVAAISLMNCEPDDMSQPYHWLSAANIEWIVVRLKAILGW